MTRKLIFRDWPKVFEEWKKSNLSISTFCKEQNIQPTVFRYNLKKYPEYQKNPEHPSRQCTDPNPSSPMKFSELTSAELQTDSGFVKITTPRGCVLEVPL